MVNLLAVAMLGGAAYLAWREAGGVFNVDLPSPDNSTGYDFGFAPLSFGVTDMSVPAGYVADPYAGELDNKSISFRNRNPLNLRPGDRWQGMIGTDNSSRAGAFVQFDTPENGYRAAAITLINYATVYNANTLETIIGRWAPPEDRNDTAAYVAKVAAETGIDPRRPLDLANDPQSLAAIMTAMTKVESGGHNPFKPETVREGIRRAYERFGKVL